MKFSILVSLLFLPITGISAESNMAHCNAFTSELETQVQSYRNSSIHDIASLICSDDLCTQMLTELTNSAEPVIMVKLHSSCTGIRGDNQESCSTLFEGLTKNQQTQTLCEESEGVTGCTFDAAQCTGSAACEAAFASAEINQRRFPRCINVGGSNCTFQPAPFENACIEQYADDNFYNNPQARNLLEEAFRNRNDCTDAVTTHLSSRRRLQEEARGLLVLKYFAVVVKANSKEQIVAKKLKRWNREEGTGIMGTSAAVDREIDEEITALSLVLSNKLHEKK